MASKICSFMVYLLNVIASMEFVVAMRKNVHVVKPYWKQLLNFGNA
jgi:hypothetical protein